MKGEPFKKFAGILKQVAPTLLSAAVPAAAPLIGSIAKRVLGDKAMTDEQLEEQIAVATGSVEGLAKLRAIEAELQKAELDNGFKFAELEQRNEETLARDRADARARQIATGDGMPAMVFYITTLGFFAVLGYLMRWGLPQNGGEVLLLLLGALSSAWTSCVVYFVGSTSGSKAKNDLIASMKKGDA